MIERFPPPTGHLAAFCDAHGCRRKTRALASRRSPRRSRPTIGRDANKNKLDEALATHPIFAPADEHLSVARYIDCDLTRECAARTHNDRRTSPDAARPRMAPAGWCCRGDSLSSTYETSHFSCPDTDPPSPDSGHRHGADAVIPLGARTAYFRSWREPDESFGRRRRSHSAG